MRLKELGEKGGWKTGGSSGRRIQLHASCMQVVSACVGGRRFACEVGWRLCMGGEGDGSRPVGIPDGRHFDRRIQRDQLARFRQRDRRATPHGRCP